MGRFASEDLHAWSFISAAWFNAHAKTLRLPSQLVLCQLELKHVLTLASKGRERAAIVDFTIADFG